jgi:hypothetical protein
MKIQRTSSINPINYIDTNRINNKDDTGANLESVRARNSLTATLAKASVRANDASEAERLVAANSMNAPEESITKDKKSKKIVKLKSINTKSEIRDITEQGNYLEDTVLSNHSNRMEELQQQSIEKNMSEIGDQIKNNIKKSKVQLGAVAISNALITTGLISFDLDELSAAALVGAHAGTLVLALIALSRIPHHINIEKIFVKLMRSELLNEKDRNQLEKYLDKLKKNNPELTDAKIAELLEMGKNSSKNTKNHINLNYYEQIDQQKAKKVQKRQQGFEQSDQQQDNQEQQQQKDQDQHQSEQKDVINIY